MELTKNEEVFCSGVRSVLLSIALWVYCGCTSTAANLITLLRNSNYSFFNLINRKLYLVGKPEWKRPLET
jgi:hypothetical protein